MLLRKGLYYLRKDRWSAEGHAEGHFEASEGNGSSGGRVARCCREGVASLKLKQTIKHSSDVQN